MLNSKDYGIPQNRERVFTISIRNDIDRGYEFPPKQELKLRLKDLLEDEVDEKYYLSNKGVFYFKQQAIQRGENINETETKKLLTIGHGENKGSMKDLDISPTLDTNFSNFWRGVLLEPVLVKNKGQELVKKTDIATTLLARDYKGLGNQNGNAVILIKNANSKGYDEATEGDSIDLTYPNSTTRRGRVGHQVSQTIPASDTKGVVSKDLRIRKLTPKECWRLMGFSDEAFDKASQVNSNTQLYKQAGNSIVVNVLEAIFKELLGE